MGVKSLLPLGESKCGIPQNLRVTTSTSALSNVPLGTNRETTSRRCCPEKKRTEERPGEIGTVPGAGSADLFLCGSSHRSHPRAADLQNRAALLAAGTQSNHTAFPILHRSMSFAIECPPLLVNVTGGGQITGRLPTGQMVSSISSHRPGLGGMSSMFLSPCSEKM